MHLGPKQSQIKNINYKVLDVVELYSFDIIVMFFFTIFNCRLLISFCTTSISRIDRYF